MNTTRIAILPIAALAMLFATTAAFGAAVSPKNDYCWIQDDGPLELDVGESVNTEPRAYFYAESGSEATVSVSGLPSGVRFNAKTCTFSGAPSKKGVYYVTYSAKNKNGYSHSVTLPWNVGGADNGDYDGIGLEVMIGEDGLEALLNMTAGVDTEICTMMQSVTGLPPGVKFHRELCDSHGNCAECSGFIMGNPTKPGKYRLTFTDFHKNKAVMTVIVRDPGCSYVDFVPADPSMGTTSGSKVYAAGAKAKMSAKAKPGYVFAGWYWDEDFEDPFYCDSGDWRKASDSVVVGDWGYVDVYARFVPKWDDEIWFDACDEWEVCTGCGDGGSDYCEIYVESGSLPAVTVKGLPVGIKWDKTAMCLVADLAKVKPGRTLAKLTAKNASGNTATHEIEIVVPNIESDVFEDLDYSSDAYSLTLGVSDVCVYGWVSFSYDSDWKVTASGLPPGLKLDTGYSSGWTQYATVRGTPTKAGSYTVTLNAKNGSRTERATFTINVEPLPPEAVGTFNGVLKDADGGGIVGMFTFIAAANGKQSVKVVTAAGSWSLSEGSWNCSYDNILTAYFKKTSAKEAVELRLDLDMGEGWNSACQMTGEFKVSRYNGAGLCNPWSTIVDAEVAYAQRNPFAKTKGSYDNPSAATLANELARDYKARKMVLSWNDEDFAYDLACRECVLGYDGSGTATLTVDKNGTAKISGKLYDLYSFSASATLMFDEDGCFTVFCPLVKMKACGISASGRESCSTYSELVPIVWRP